MNRNKDTNQNTNQNSNKHTATFSAQGSVEKRYQLNCLQTPPGDIPIRKPHGGGKKG